VTPIFLKCERGFLLLLISALGTPTLPASSSCCLQTCVGSLTDEIALELCKRRKDVEDKVTRSGCSINLLLQTLEANTSCAQVAHDLHKMGKGAS
jgi:hypothetical protein